MHLLDDIMLTVSLLSFFMTVGDTKLADAFANDRLSGVPKVNGGKFESSTLTLRKGASHPRNSAATRASCRSCAAKNTEKANSKDEPYYWIDEACNNNFQITLHDEDEDQDTKAEHNKKRISKLRFKICGKPRPLQRHRTSRFRTYNPSVKYQKSFQDALEKLIAASGIGAIDYPIFEETEYLVMTIIFRMKRPKNHFVNNRPGPGRLKEKSPSQLSSIRSDVDNLTKFVLDSLNEVMYEDDRQITSIHATKLLDNEDLCSGSVEVFIRSIDVEDVEKIVESSISIADERVQ